MAPVLHCSFCGKSQDDVPILIDADDAAICDRCVEVCVGLVFEHKRPKGQPNLIATLNKWRRDQGSASC